MIGNIIILAAGALQALVLSSLLLFKKAGKTAFIFLVIYLWAITAQLIFKIAEKGWLMNNVSLGYSLSYHLPLLYGPLVWLFARSLMKSTQIKTFDIIHALPFGMAALLAILPEFDAGQQWLYLPFFGWYGMGIQLVLLVCYHLNSLALWKKYNAGIKSHFSDIHVIRMLWVKKFILYSMAVSTAIAMLLMIIYKSHPDLSFLRWGFLSLVMFIYWISFTAIQHPQVFTHIVNRSIISRMERVDYPLFPVKKPAARYASSHLLPEEALRLEIALAESMDKHKLFTDPGLSIEKLATHLHTNRHFLSQVLNQRMKKSFYEYINAFRVREAKHLLTQPSKAHLKISSIAYDAGFNSLSAFNDVFRRITGVTPSVFRKTGSTGEQQQEAAG